LTLILQKQDILVSRYYATLAMLGLLFLQFLFRFFSGNGSHFWAISMLLYGAFGAAYSLLLMTGTYLAQVILKPTSPMFYRTCVLVFRDLMVPAFGALSQTSPSSQTLLGIIGNWAVFFGVSSLVLWRFNALKT